MNTHAHHHHSHDHHHHAHAYGRAFIIGIALNAAFVLAEILYGIHANSLGLLADAGHNASDVISLCMAWGATFLARKRPTPRFTYGFQSASIVAALANALLLMIAVGGIGWEAVQRLMHPEPSIAGTVIVVACIGVLINGITAWLFHGDSHDLNINGAFLHMLADMAVSVGVVLSGICLLAFGWAWVDPLASLVIALVIVAGTWNLLKESLNLSLHAAPAAIDPLEVKDYLSAQTGVSEVHDLHIWAMSTTGTALSAHLIMPTGHPGDRFIEQLTHALEERFHIGHATLQIEMGNGSECHSGCP